jgi:hypothetical protein
MRRRSVGEAERPFARSRRRDVAVACSFGPRTVAEVARQLATEPGSVTSVIRAMASDGVLLETEALHADGHAYILADEWRAPLAEAVGTSGPRGLIEPTQRLLLVGARDAAIAPEAAALIALDPIVLWVARLDGHARLLVVARGEDPADRTRVDRLEASVASTGAECLQFAVTQLFTNAEFVTYARTIGQRSPLDALGPAPPIGG